MRKALLCNVVAIIVGAMGLVFIDILGPVLGGVIPVIVRAANEKS